MDAFFGVIGNKVLLEMNGESDCRYGEIYYGCYNKKNSCKNLFYEEDGNGVEITLFIRRGMDKFSNFINRCSRE